MFLTIAALSFQSLQAGPTEWFKNTFGKSVEADPNKEYTVSETNGPWMVLVTTYSGPQARKNANELVYELRKNYKYKAYLCEQSFTHDIKKEKSQKSQNPYAPKHNYKKNGTFQECAVLIGDFQSIDDLDLQKTMDAVRECHPECVYRQYGKTVPKNISKGTTGPFRSSFAVTNPVLPPDFFTQKGVVDKFIESINAQRPYSLLNCPRRYTVQIATFSGRVEIKPDKVNRILDGKEQFSSGKVSELELGEKAAAKLCKILREKGMEAYEFHDRYASIVTIGSFDSYGQEQPNGMIELRPEIIRIMNDFQGKPAKQGVGQGTISHEPVRFDGIECDVQPRIIEVPKVRR